jgi:hypothetical protein
LGGDLAPTFATSARRASTPPRSGRCTPATRRESPLPGGRRRHRGGLLRRCGHHPDLRRGLEMPSELTTARILCGIVSESSPERTGGGRRRGRRVAGGIGFRPKNTPPAYIYMDRRRNFLGALKTFMGRTAFMGSDQRRLWPETIKSPDFYGFRAFFGCG